MPDIKSDDEWRAENNPPAAPYAWKTLEWPKNTGAPDITGMIERLRDDIASRLPEGAAIDWTSWDLELEPDPAGNKLTFVVKLQYRPWEDE